MIIITLAFKLHNTKLCTIIITFAFKLHRNPKTFHYKEKIHHLSTNNMAHYNRLSEVVYDKKLTCWRFRVIYPFYSSITGNGPHWVYVLADEDGTKMEMTIYDIKCVATGHHAYAFREGFQNMGDRGEVIVVLKMWRLSKTFSKVIYTSYVGPIELWLEIKGRLFDFRFNPLLPKVEEFRHSLLRSDPYVQRPGAIRPL
ncbi:hypothetical protein HID58_081715 [Brassica napus]|uniref:Ubiquitin-like protease family profile domain-containing protein n=1 Tax=Brassica napus TaxID=3708 RepID=A0ABQ7Y8J4_BRANA|nr:hypothetical protein HID58_081715 [Brassica napus]